MTLIDKKDLGSVIRETFIKLVVKQAMSKMISALPVLGSWLLNPIISWLTFKLVTFIVDKTILGVMLLKIDFEINDQIKDVEQKLSKLKDLPEDATESQKNEAIDAVNKAYDDLINFK